MWQFFTELKHRHVYRVGAGYAVTAWLALKLINTVAPGLGPPPWVAQAFLLFLVIGFPVALVLAWTLELHVSSPDAAARPQSSAPGFGWENGRKDGAMPRWA